MKRCFVAFLLVCLLFIGGCYSGHQEQNSSIETPSNKSSELVSSETSSAEDPAYTKIYGYSRLSDLQKSVYDILESGIIKADKPYLFEKSVDFTEISEVITMFECHHEYENWRKNRYYVMFEGEMAEKVVGIRADKIDNSGLDDQLDENFDKNANEMIKELPPSTADDYTKIKAIAELICKTASYNHSAMEQNQTILSKKQREINQWSLSEYGIVVYKTAVCEGYSRAFQYFADRLGVTSLMVRGKANGDFHAWNMVLLDGKWYHVDTTWMDSDGGLNYNYFMVSTKSISNTHFDITWTPIPEKKYESAIFELPESNEDYNSGLLS